MGTVVPLEAQEGNKYILTLIMKAFVAYALAAFAAIAANPIEATPYSYQSGVVPMQRPAPYGAIARPIGKRHANEPDVYDYDYGAAPYQQYRLTYKRGAYEENDYAAPALTKRAVVPAYEEIGHRLTYSSLP